VLLNTFTGTKAWISGRTIRPSDYRTFGLSIQNPKKSTKKPRDFDREIQYRFKGCRGTCACKISSSYQQCSRFRTQKKIIKLKVNPLIKNTSKFITSKGNYRLKLSTMTAINEKLYNGTFKFHKVVWQQTCGEVAACASASYTVYHQVQT